MSKSNIAARAGAWSARHRKLAIIGWFVAVIAAAAIGGAIGTRPDAHEGNGQSGRVDTFLRHHFPESSNEEILIQARQGQVASSPQFRAAVRDVARRDARIPYVATSPRRTGPDSTARSPMLTRLWSASSSPRRQCRQGPHGHSPRHTGTRRCDRGVRRRRLPKALNKSLGQDFSRAETLSLRSPC